MKNRITGIKNMRKNKANLILVLLLIILLSVLCYHLTPKPVKKGTLSGNVIDNDTGLPVWGVTVKALDEDGNTSQKSSDTTNKQGHFKIELDEGTYTLRFESAQYQGFESSDSYYIESDNETEIKKSFSLEPSVQFPPDPPEPPEDPEEPTSGPIQDWKEQFLAAVENTYSVAHSNGYKIGDSKTAPPCEDKLISGDRLIARSLWDIGYTDQPQGGIKMDSIDNYLSSHGFVKIWNETELQSGDIVIMSSDGTISAASCDIMVIVQYDRQNDSCVKYDASNNPPQGVLSEGAHNRIECVQPFHTVLNEYNGEKNFYCAFRHA